MSRKLLSDRLQKLDRKVVFGGVVLLILLLVAGYYFTAGGGDSEEGVMTFSEEGESGPAVDGVPSAGAGVVDESVIAERVAATLAAMPTPEPTPTPDIGATLAAELAMNRPERAIVLNPLDVQDVRTPHLTEKELDYFREMGGRIWAYTKVWLRLQDVLGVDSFAWSEVMLTEHVEWAKLSLDAAPVRPPGGSSEVSELVLAYVDSLEVGMDGIRDAVSRMDDAREIIVEAQGMSVEDREAVARAARDMERLLGEFDETMSSYGCSICGELFRYRGNE